MTFYIKNIPLAVATAILTFVVLIFCEITPKRIANKDSENILLFYTSFIKLSLTIFYPVVFLLSFLSDGIANIIGVNLEEEVDTYSEEELANIIYEYGEEKCAKKIAKNICIARKSKIIETTGELVQIIKQSIPIKSSKDGHPAKRTFQAIRIEVNNEIKPLYNTIIKSIKSLKQGGRLCVITFHSLEDRAVKNAYNDALREMHLS